jgi:dephospho-CoA kinase
MESVYDATIAVVADEALRADRARARGHEALDERAARQLSQEEKAARATYTVVNDGSESDLESELAVILRELAR